MAAFPYQHSLFLLDSVYLLPNTPIKMSASLEDGGSNHTSCFSSHYPPHDQPLQEALLYNNNVIIHETYNTSAFSSDNDPSELDYGDHVTQKAEISLVNKRKTRDDSSSCSSLSKGVKEVKPKKQKKSNNNGLKERFEKKRKSDKKEVTEEPPSGYIHVRARRGQATDNHSLAERVRREKMSERMKLLQGLVPGCDKVTGKALMLDEIINYVQSLQYQVEFHCMKLASMNPILYNFGEDLDTHMIKTEKVRSLGSSPIPIIHQANPTQPTPFADTTATLTTRNDNYSVQDNALSSFLLQQGKLEMLNALSQDNENLLWMWKTRDKGFSINVASTTYVLSNNIFLCMYLESSGYPTSIW